ncbi:hypothetical protein [Gillisia sp. Hel_I_29]|uniref:hypothetical protein n=1 Tax=Gillisia sp. Hel_I_29 TaxID=1249975 RepID=UPI0005554B18|nr:hypothetical protein [Gillisia sp. Hel_I_29]
MKENHISFEGKYINGKALYKLFDFSENKFITKTSPGIGVTTALLNYTSGNIIIISPLTPMIEKKAMKVGEYSSTKQFFKCNKLKSNWKDVLDYLKKTPIEQQNIIINCTPDSICGLFDNNEELFERLIQIPIIVDEYDTVVLQSQLRPDCGRFLELVFNKWVSNFTLTTATPNYEYLDIPSDKNIPIYTVGREINTKINVCVSNEYKDAFRFIHNEIELGHKVACFTNNLNVHKKDITTLQKSMAGENLTLKLEYYDITMGDISDGNLFKDSNLIVFSGKYFIGYDIEEDISVVILSEAKNQATRIGVNLAVQALFRCRGNIINALYVNTRLKNNFLPQKSSQIDVQKEYHIDVNYYTQKASKYKFPWQVNENESITPELYCNRGRLASDMLNKIYWLELHMTDSLTERFNKYEIDLIPYQSPDIEIEEKKGVNFIQRILNVSEGDSEEMQTKYEKVVANLRFNNQGSHNSNRAMERLTALIIKVIDDKDLFEKLDNPKLKPKAFYEYFDKYLQRNYPHKYLVEHFRRSPQCLKQIKILKAADKNNVDTNLLTHWYLFYSVFKVLKDEFPEGLNRLFFIRKTAGDWSNLEPFEDNKKQRHTLAYRAVKKIIKSQFNNIQVEEERSIEKIIGLAYSKNDKDKYKYLGYNESSIKKKISDSVHYWINPKIKIENEKGREYNPMTKLNKIYRKVFPFDYILVDLISANAQFVDKILKIDMYSQVYDNIMLSQDIDRDKAKQQYNKFLNSHYLTRTDAIKFYTEICGYDVDSAIRLAAITAQVDKGSFYMKMTEQENLALETYNQHFDYKGIRLHDGLILSPWDIIEPIPLQVNGYKFNISYFNSNKPYMGNVCNDNLNVSLLFG